MTHNPPDSASSQPATLSTEEVGFILDGVRRHDPKLIESLIDTNIDITPFVATRKARLKPEQAARIKALDFAQLLALGDDLARNDADFEKRWRVLTTPKGRVWLKQTLKRIQAVLP